MHLCRIEFYLIQGVLRNCIKQLKKKTDKIKKSIFQIIALFKTLHQIIPL